MITIIKSEMRSFFLLVCWVVYRSKYHLVQVWYWIRVEPYQQAIQQNRWYLPRSPSSSTFSTGDLELSNHSWHQINGPHLRLSLFVWIFEWRGEQGHARNPNGWLCLLSNARENPEFWKQAILISYNMNTERWL